MIVQLRIDNRMIHGQVVTSWLKYTKADIVIVCNDKVAADPIQKMALPLAAPGVNVKVMSIAETLQYVNDNPNSRVFVISKFPTDALTILKSGVQIDALNVGNAAPIAGTKYVMVTKQIAATAEDAAVYREIAEISGGTLYSQVLANQEKHDFLDQLKKAGL